MTTEITPAFIAELRELRAAGTQGEWQWHSPDESGVMLTGPDIMYDHVLWSSRCPRCQKEGWKCTSPSQENQTLIAAAVNALVPLLDEVERLRAIEALVKPLLDTVDPAECLSIAHHIKLTLESPPCK